MAVCGRMGGEGEFNPQKQNNTNHSKVTITAYPPPPPPHTHSHQVYNMALTVDQLGIVRAELFEACTKWYDIGLALNVPVTILDSIEGQFGNHSEKLRETIKVWLKTATEPTWQDVVSVLKSRVVGEPKLASDIEAKHCTTAETGQASEQTIPEVQQPQLTTRGTEQHTLQQALQDSRELRIKDQQLQDSQKRIHTLQQELQTKDQHLEKKNQQLQSIEKDLLQREQTIGELRAANDQLKRQLEQAQQHATEEKTDMQQKTILDMRWHKDSKAPEIMYRGSAAADSNIAYFNGWGSHTVHSYDSNTWEWRQLADAPHTNFTLVVVQHMLTMVGGEISDAATDSLLSLKGEGGIKNGCLSSLQCQPSGTTLQPCAVTTPSSLLEGELVATLTD